MQRSTYLYMNQTENESENATTLNNNLHTIFSNHAL